MSSRPPPRVKVRDSLDINQRFIAYKRATAGHESIPRPRMNRTLWQDDSTSQPRQKATPTSRRPQYPSSVSSAPPPTDNDVLIRQPETKPISQEQLVAEVKGIYAGLVMVESKCIEVDNAHRSNASVHSPAKLDNEQWQALIALHRTLLHEHHDFFLASQHPAASPALRRLASKYAMPARMWRHGIHSFLELLRHRLPVAPEHMLTFIYLAYSMMALLYETVPDFEDTWIECLGDLGRYRMAIEDDDMSDREVWTSVSRHWYSKASEKDPTTGRLYHHLAILARPNALQQLYYYTKSLCVVTPLFVSARESILTLFDPLLRDSAHRNTKVGNEQWQPPVTLGRFPDPARMRPVGVLWGHITDNSEDVAGEHHALVGVFPNVEASKPLPEDYLMRGLIWSEMYFFAERFLDTHIPAGADDDDRGLEMPSTHELRGEHTLAFSPGQLESLSARVSGMHTGLINSPRDPSISRMLTFLAVAALAIVRIRVCDGFLTQDDSNLFCMEWAGHVAVMAAILVIVLLRSRGDWRKERQFVDLAKKTPAEDAFPHHADLQKHGSVPFLNSRQGKVWTRCRLFLSLFLATHGVPLLATAFTLHPGFRIASGVTASVSGVTVIPLRTNGSFPVWSWILAYGVWAGAFSGYLCLQTLRLPSEPNRRRPLYLFLVIMAGLHMTIAISQGSDSIPDALTMYGPILLTASAFLMALLLRAIHPGGQNAAPPDDLASTLGGAALGGFGP